MGHNHLAEFEIVLMSAILRLSSDAYATQIHDEIRDRTGRRVSTGAIYVTLGRLRRKRLIKYVTVGSRPIRGGRYRHHIQLTSAGVRALSRSVDMLLRIVPTHLARRR